MKSDLEIGDLRKLNLACGRDYRPGWLNVDMRDDSNRRLKPDIVLDLLRFPWPLKTESYDHVLCSHYIEHLPQTVTIDGNQTDALVATMAEIQRILVPDGTVEIRVPDCRDITTYSTRRRITASSARRL